MIAESSVASLFAEVWADTSMTFLRAVEGAAPTWQGLQRSGTATTLPTTTLFAEAAIWLGDSPHKQQRLPDGSKLDAVRLGDGRVAVHVVRPARVPTAAALEADGVWPPGVLPELAIALRAGHAVVLVDGRAAVRHASLCALIRELSGDAAVIAVGDDLPVAMTLMGSPATVWPQVSALHVDVLAVAEQSAEDAAQWLMQRRQAALLMSVDGDHAVWAAAMRRHGLDDHAAIVVMFQRTWPARVIEMRTPPGYETPTPADVAVVSPQPVAPAPPSSRSSPTSYVASQVAPLSLLPSEDIDPGWELGAAPSTPFERALAAAATKPHVPHAPASHPQMMALMRGTGGLTLGPPGAFDHGGHDPADRSLDDLDIAPLLPDDT